MGRSRRSRRASGGPPTGRCATRLAPPWLRLPRRAAQVRVCSRWPRITPRCPRATATVSERTRLGLPLHRRPINSNGLRCRGLASPGLVGGTFATPGRCAHQRLVPSKLLLLALCTSALPVPLPPAASLHFRVAISPWLPASAFALPCPPSPCHTFNEYRLVLLGVV